MPWRRIGLVNAMMAILAAGACTQQPAPLAARQPTGASEAAVPALPTSSALELKVPALSALESPVVLRAAKWLLVGTASFDYGETIRGISHPPILHFTEVNQGFTSIVNLNFAPSYAEGGWAKVTGAHDIYGVVAANMVVDVLIAVAARHLARKGPRWRLLAIGALLARSWTHLQGGQSWVGYSGRLAAPYSQFNPVWIN
ncbi:MAG TPA: hypothetical protein VNE83_04305 [Terriglobales bacterium]|nr:hypothetical protein [Terriglobales bacterium]